MTEDKMSFWTLLGQARESAQAGETSVAALILNELRDTCRTGDATLDRKRMELLDVVSRSCGIPFELAPPGPVAVTERPSLAGELGPITADGQPGVSLVTCAMNRSENLVKALPSWLACDELREIVIVDWSSREPVSEALAAAGLTDPRIRVIRVEGEPRWILSYAFNIGFRAASCRQILKCDADIVVDPRFFELNPLRPGCFVAGNWRRAAEGQAYVNGFFYIWKKDLAKVGGFNEFITTYGWDDDDIYDRLVQEGVTRCDVEGDTIYHLPHDDEARTGDAAASVIESAAHEIGSGTKFLIRRNRFIANVMPSWNERAILLPMVGEDDDHAVPVLRRQGYDPNPVPDHTVADADFYAMRELASWRLGRRVLELDRRTLPLLLDRPFGKLSLLEVEILLGNAPEGLGAADAFCVIDLDPALLPTEGSRAAKGVETLRALAAARGMAIAFRGPFTAPHESMAPRLRTEPFLPSWFNIGMPGRVGVGALRDTATALPSRNVVVTFDATALDALETAPAPAAPAVASGRKRLFMDCQHGLGNRMRALGSAASIAAKTDRELVVVWQPDHHCDCTFTDLFDYSGAVIDESFVDGAAATCDVYNYMEVEGGEKDKPVDVNSPRDIYGRAAFVLQSPFSNWEGDNAFLQGLTPVSAITDLVMDVRHPNDLSAHVRMEAGAGLDHNSYDQPDGNWSEKDHELIHHWRAKSHFSHFLKRIDALIEAGEVETLFLATDLPETYETFRKYYGDRLAWLERSLFDRSKEQLYYALADAILLSRAPRLLGSTWSSFSELAMRLAPQKMVVEMSGTDF